MIARIRKQAPWWAIGLVLLLPALGGGYSLLLGWPQASLIFALIFALMLTHPDTPRRLPWWYWTLGAGLALLALVWLWPGQGLLFLSPTRASWPGPRGEISGIAANRVGTRESLFQALGFFAVLGIALLSLDRPARRRSLMRWMVVCLGAVFAAALVIHFLRLDNNILPDVPVLYWTRLSYPFTGANLAAAFFVSSLPFAAGMWLVHSSEERYLPARRVWQLVGTVVLLSMLALQVMTQNRWMWISLTPFLLGGASWYLLRRRSRRRRLRALLVILFLTGLTAAFLCLFNPGGVVSRFVLVIEQDKNSTNRPLIWLNAWNTFQEYPWVGVGLGGFAEVCPTTAPEGIYAWPRYAHSEPLQWLAETGIAGVTLLLAVTCGMLHTVWRQVRDRLPWQERAPFAAAALLLGMACLIDFPLRCPALLFLFALYLGAALAQDRTTAELVAETTPGLASATDTSWDWRRRIPAIALPVLLLLALAAFLPSASSLFRRGQALADFHFQKRSFDQDHDGVALAAAAENLLEQADHDPRWSGEALVTLTATSESPADLVRWEPDIEAIMAGSPYHDSFYYLQALVALGHGDDVAAVEFNAKARYCAATNRNTLRKIAGLDWFLAAAAAEPGLRAARLRHAQETTRWLLTGNPEWASAMAETCRQMGLGLDDFLPSLPATWDQPGALCQICIERDRPLTALDLMARNNLYDRAEAASAASGGRVLTRWDLQVLTATGQADKVCERIGRLYRETAPSLRPGLLADVRLQGWGVLTPDQWEEFVRQVENSLPGAMERYQLGQLYLKMGQRGRACQVWLNAYKQERRPELALALAQVYSTNSAWAVAADYARDAADLDENNPAAWRLLARILVANRDFRAAQKAFDRYKAVAPDRAASDSSLYTQILTGLGQATGTPDK